MNANYAFLLVIFLATYWHVDEMNWKSNIIVAHIWVLAYTIEPIMLYLLEPRSAESKAPLPAELQEGPVLPGLKRVAVVGLVVAATLGSLLVHQSAVHEYTLALAARPVQRPDHGSLLDAGGRLVPGGVFRRPMGGGQAGRLWIWSSFPPAISHCGW